MVKVFVEYRILDECRQEFLIFIGKIAARHPHMGVYEGTDQPGLFVEIWDGLEQDEYLVMKEERSGLVESVWNGMEAYVVGGKGKIQIWSFTPTVLRQE